MSERTTPGGGAALMSGLGETGDAILRHIDSSLGREQLRSIAEAGLPIELVGQAEELLCRASAHALDAVLGSGTPCLNGPGHIGHAGTIVSNDAALGLVLLTVASFRARRLALPGEVWPAFAGMRFRNPQTRRLLIDPTGQPTRSMKHSLDEACRALSLRQPSKLHDSQRWYHLVSLHAGLLERDASRVVSWLDVEKPQAIRDLLHDPRLRSPSFVQLWRAMANLRSGLDQVEAWRTIDGSPWVLHPDALLDALLAGPPPACAPDRVAHHQPQHEFIRAVSVRLRDGGLRLRLELDSALAFEGDRVDLLVDGAYRSRLLRQRDGTFRALDGSSTVETTITELPAALALRSPTGDIEHVDLEVLSPSRGAPRCLRRRADGWYVPDASTAQGDAALVSLEDLEELDGAHVLGDVAWLDAPPPLRARDRPMCTVEVIQVGTSSVAARVAVSTPPGHRVERVDAPWLTTSTIGHFEGRIPPEHARDPLPLRVTVLNATGQETKDRLVASHALEGLLVRRATTSGGIGWEWLDGGPLDRSALRLTLRPLARANPADLVALETSGSAYRLGKPAPHSCATMLRECAWLGEPLDLVVPPRLPSRSTRLSLALIDRGLFAHVRSPTTSGSLEAVMDHSIEAGGSAYRLVRWRRAGDVEVIAAPDTLARIQLDPRDTRAIGLAFAGERIGALWCDDWFVGLDAAHVSDEALQVVRWLRVPVLAPGARSVFEQVARTPASLARLLQAWLTPRPTAPTLAELQFRDRQREHLPAVLRALLPTTCSLPADAYAVLRLGFDPSAATSHVVLRPERFLYGHIVSRLLEVSPALAEAFIETTGNPTRVARQLWLELGLGRANDGQLRAREEQRLMSDLTNHALETAAVASEAQLLELAGNTEPTPLLRHAAFRRWEFCRRMQRLHHRKSKTS